MFVSMMLNQYEPDVPPTFIARPYVPLDVDTNSRLGKKLLAMRLRQDKKAQRLAAQQARRLECKRIRRLPREQRAVAVLPTELLPVATTKRRTAKMLRAAPHVGLSRSCLSIIDYVKASLF